MAKDVRGISRVNLFEVLESSSGVRYSALRGSETAITYRGSDGSEVTTPNYRMSGDEIAAHAAMTDGPYPVHHNVSGRVR